MRPGSDSDSVMVTEFGSFTILLSRYCVRSFMVIYFRTLERPSTLAAELVGRAPFFNQYSSLVRSIFTWSSFMPVIFPIVSTTEPFSFSLSGWTIILYV